MKKRIIAVSVLAAAAVLSGCMTQPVDQPGSRRPEGREPDKSGLRIAKH